MNAPVAKRNSAVPQAAAHPLWIPATVLFREIVERGYVGGQSQLRAFMRTLRPKPLVEALVRFETAPGEQMQVDWVKFRAGGGRSGNRPLYAFCATLVYCRASFVEFVSDMKVDTLIACHQRAFDSFGGVVKKVLYDNMKTVVLERDHYGDGQHRFHAGFSTTRSAADLSTNGADRIGPRPKARSSASTGIRVARIAHFACRS